MEAYVYAPWAPQTVGPASAVLAAILGSAALCALAGRVWARVVLQRRNDAIDDWLMIAAMVCDVTFVLESKIHEEI